MTYEFFERLGGKPIEVYHFSRGTDVWAHTSWPQAVQRGTYVYEPSPITRSSIEVNEEARSNEVTLTVPHDHAIAEEFKRKAPGVKMALIIYRRQEDDTADQWDAIFTGEVVSSSVAEGSAELRCAPMQQVVERRLLNVIGQPLCNNRLFDERCQVSRAAWTWEFVVLDFSDPFAFPPLGLLPFSAAIGAFIKLEAAALVEFADDLSGPNAMNPAHWLMGGVAQFEDQKQSINLHVEDGIWLLGQFDGIEIGDTLTLYAGCDKIVRTCHEKFDNLPRFLGFPYMPIKNPFGDEGIA